MDNEQIEKIARRRMANTGETYEEAAASVRRVLGDIQGDADRGGQGWVAEWTAAVPWERNEEALTWMRARPPTVQALMIDFPVSCVVKAVRELVVPQPGTYGIVLGYTEPRAGDPRGLLLVTQHPNGRTRAECSPEALEVVGYWRGWTSERMRRVLAGGEY